jgi:hypothetical protein
VFLAADSRGYTLIKPWLFLGGALAVLLDAVHAAGELAGVGGFEAFDETVEPLDV